MEEVVDEDLDDGDSSGLESEAAGEGEEAQARGGGASPPLSPVRGAVVDVRYLSAEGRAAPPLLSALHAATVGYAAEAEERTTRVDAECGRIAQDGDSSSQGTASAGEQDTASEPDSHGSASDDSDGSSAEAGPLPGAPPLRREVVDATLAGESLGTGGSAAAAATLVAAAAEAGSSAAAPVLGSADVVADLESLRGLLAGALQELLPAVGSAMTGSRGQRHPKRARQSEAALALLVRAFTTSLSELGLCEQWLASEAAWPFADHVALVLLYLLLLCSSSRQGLRAAGRIQNAHYEALYDGVSVPDLLRSLGGGLVWTVPGHMLMLASRLQGVNECLSMIRRGFCCAPDGVVMRIVRGETPLLDPAYGSTVDGLYDARKARASLDAFIDHLMVANACAKHGFHHRSAFKRAYKMATGGAYYQMFRAAGRHQGEVAYTGDTAKVMTDTLPFAAYMWNMPDSPLVKRFYMLGLPRVRHSYAFALAHGGVDVRARFICDVDFALHPRNLDQLPKAAAQAQAEAAPQAMMLQ
jgi:hypothetical protein